MGKKEPFISAQQRKSIKRTLIIWLLILIISQLRLKGDILVFYQSRKLRRNVDTDHPSFQKGWQIKFRS